LQLYDVFYVVSGTWTVTYVACVKAVLKQPGTQRQTAVILLFLLYT